MSNALAIASVTRALLDVLNDGLINDDVASAVGQSITVTAMPPDRVLSQQAPNAPDPTQLNLYLYNVSYNAAWRNTELPTRDGRGNSVTQPLLPLDLHYLLTAYGASDLHSEILLGYAMQVLHETPVLTRAALRRTLTAGAVDAQILPPAFNALRSADLADQFELVKLAPSSMGTDELSKIWTAFQSHYRTSTTYDASVVLIESRRPARSTLPVLTRNVFVNPDLLPPIPTITLIEPVRRQTAARLGERVDIRGARLDGLVTARFRDARSAQTMTLATASGTQMVSATLPTGAGQGGANPGDGADTDNWRCGTYEVNLSVPQAVGPPRLTNSMSLTIAPRITTINAATVAGLTTFTLSFEPRARAGQTIHLIVGTRELAPQPFGPAPTGTLQFQGRNFVSGTTEFVRLRIDGIDSILVDRMQSPPVFSATDQVMLP